MIMKNIVTEMNALKKLLDTEAMLRAAASSEFDNGVQNGVYKQAHDQTILAVVSAAQVLVDKVNSSE